MKVLNLFAYTGGATLAAAAAGASVTHVDASKGMVTWARENAAASGLQEKPIRWLVDDCMKFVEREIRRGNRYDGIIMDPPSYGRGPRGEIWKIEDAVYPLICRCEKLLGDDPLFFLVNSYTTGLAPAVLAYMISVALKGRGGCTEASEIGLPVSSTGLILPCGASGRWEEKKRFPLTGGRQATKIHVKITGNRKTGDCAWAHKVNLRRTIMKDYRELSREELWLFTGRQRQNTRR